MTIKEQRSRTCGTDLTNLHGYKNEILHRHVQRHFTFGWYDNAIHPITIILNDFSRFQGHDNRKIKETNVIVKLFILLRFYKFKEN